MSETLEHRRLSELRSLLRAIEDAGWEYARVELDGVALVVSSDPHFAAGDTSPTTARTTAAASSHEPQAAGEPAPQPTAAAAAPAPEQPVAAPEPAPSNLATAVETVTSPTIGLFWRSPKPGAPPFVTVGDSVAAGDTLCIIEVMKLMTHVTAPVAGTVAAIHIENGSMVEHGTALIDVEPSEDAEGSA